MLYAPILDTLLHVPSCRKEEGMSPSPNTQRIHLKVLESPPIARDIQAFLLDAQARDLSPGRLRFYRQKLRSLLDYLTDQGLKDIESVTPNHLRGWLVHLQRTHHNSGGVHACFRAAKAFFRWLYREGYLSENPVARLTAPRTPLELLEPVSLEVVRAVLDTCDKRSKLGCRDRAIILGLLDTGCRASEFLSINIGDVNFDDGSMLIRHSKGRKARVVFLGAKSRRGGGLALPQTPHGRGDIVPPVGDPKRRAAELLRPAGYPEAAGAEGRGGRAYARQLRAGLRPVRSAEWGRHLLLTETDGPQ